MDTTRAALEMVVTGMTKQYPSVKIILSHAGGFLPYAIKRFSVLLHDYTMKNMSEDDIAKELKTFYFDVALSAPDALPSLLSVVDQSHIVFGSDNPYISHDKQAEFTRALDEYPGLPDGLLYKINRKTPRCYFHALRGRQNFGFVLRVGYSIADNSKPAQRALGSGRGGPPPCSPSGLARVRERTPRITSRTGARSCRREKQSSSHREDCQVPLAAVLKLRGGNEHELTASNNH